MASSHSTRSTLILLSALFISFFDTAKPYALRRTLPLIDTVRITNDLYPQVDITNATHHQSSLLANRIACFDPIPDRPLATIEGCRSVLRKFKTFPDYRRVQDFQVDVFPRKPSPPPFSVHDRNCKIEVKAANTLIIDRFSFEQIRTLAQEIIEDCSDRGGVGGIASIGRGIGWIVTVKGVKNRPDAGGSTVTESLHRQEASSVTTTPDAAILA